ncbi:MAG: twin-arginine translocase subunit TatC [Anaerolineaceae bacterium]|nr:twin-arginine translocase subunit TatC [Anaerolineaceae bacterium]
MVSRLKSLRRSAPPPQLPDPDPNPDDGQHAHMSFWDHLDELRERLFKAVIALVIGTVGGMIVAVPVLQYLQQPYGDRFIVLGPTGGVVSYFRVALMLGAIIAIPIITYQLLMFILPGLTRKETRWLMTSLPFITLLFLIGVGFAWFILIPPALGFLQNFQPDLFVAEWTADLYLGFVTALLFWMGVAFETPLVFFVVALLGFIGPRALIKNWRIAIIGAAVAAAAITPTIDPVNMMLVMGPLLVLYGFSIILVSIGRRFSNVGE